MQVIIRSRYTSICTTDAEIKAADTKYYPEGTAWKKAKKKSKLFQEQDVLWQILMTFYKSIADRGL